MGYPIEVPWVPMGYPIEVPMGSHGISHHVRWDIPSDPQGSHRICHARRSASTGTIRPRDRYLVPAWSVTQHKAGASTGSNGAQAKSGCDHDAVPPAVAGGAAAPVAAARGVSRTTTLGTGLGRPLQRGIEYVINGQESLGFRLTRFCWQSGPRRRSISRPNSWVTRKDWRP